MQKGMRIKSKDIYFVGSIFYLANKWIFDIDLFLHDFSQRLYDLLVFCLLLQLKEPASIPPASSWRSS